MSNANNFGLVGIAANFVLGKLGLRIRNNNGGIEARNNEDTTFVPFRAASPVGDDDVVTKRYLRTQSNITVNGQINGASPPAVVNGSVYICTTSGGAYTAENYYRGESGSWVEYTPTDGLIIMVTTALTGGTIEFLADTLYEYDGNSSNWVNIGGAGTLNKVQKVLNGNLAFNTASSFNIDAPLSDGAIVTEAKINVTQAFNGTSPTLSIGYAGAGNTDKVGKPIEIDLTTVGIYDVSCFEPISGTTQILGTYSAGSSTTGVASITIEYSLA